MATHPKYLIKGNLSERQIEADVAQYFSWCTPRDSQLPLRLLDINEQLTGADKRYDSGIAIYMQFKKSTGLYSVNEVPLSGAKNRSRLEDIRQFRAANGLEEDHSLFFKLREKKKAFHLQHNILLSHEKKGISRAFYVAPLELDKTLYYKALFSTESRFSGDPIRYRHQILRDKYLSRWFNFSPYLREHVAITPHEHVSDHQHFYSYSQTGTDVCWHSPQIVDGGPSRLSDVMSRVVEDAFLSDAPEAPSLRQLAGSIREMSREFGFADSTEGSPLQFLYAYGSWLGETHGIRQFLLLSESNRGGRHGDVL